MYAYARSKKTQIKSKYVRIKHEHVGCTPKIGISIIMIKPRALMVRVSNPFDGNYNHELYTRVGTVTTLIISPLNVIIM